MTDYDGDDWIEFDQAIYYVLEFMEEYDGVEQVADIRESLERSRDALKEFLCIHTEPKIVKSPTTGKTYVATVWKDLGEGRMITYSKREVEEPNPKQQN